VDHGQQVLLSISCHLTLRLLSFRLSHCRMACSSSSSSEQDLAAGWCPDPEMELLPPRCCPLHVPPLHLFPHRIKPPLMVHRPLPAPFVLAELLSAAASLPRAARSASPVAV
jgi:hypothetical protein